MRENLNKDNDDIDLEEATRIENAIDLERDKLMDYHYDQLENKVYSTQVGFVFMDYLNRLEKIGDHLFNVNEAPAGVKIKSAYETVMEKRG